MKVLDILKEISSDNGKIFKKDTIEKYKDNKTFTTVLSLAYNPNVKYHIKDISYYGTKQTQMITLDEALIKLNDISSRKVTGDDAKELLNDILSELDSDDDRVIKLIIGKDLKMGCGTSTINKAIPKLIPKTPYMGAVGFNETKAKKLFEDGKECELDVKMDGRYVNLICKNGSVEMVSRQCKPSLVPNQELINTAKYTSLFIAHKYEIDDGIVFNGELMMEGVERYEANGIISSIVSITQKELEGKDVTKDKAKFKKKHMDFDKAVASVYVTIWDFLPYENYVNNSGYDMPRSNRLDILEKNMPLLTNVIRLVEYKIVKSYDEAIALFQEWINRGEEGAILKSLDGVWADKKPVYQIKMKLEFTVDLTIVGFNEGAKGSKFEGTLGSLQCMSLDHKLKADAGGISDVLRDEIWSQQALLLHKIVEIKCNGISTDADGNYSLLHPVFKGFRDDTGADTLSEIIEIQDMVLGLSK